MKDQSDLARGWLAKANSDLATAALVLEVALEVWRLVLAALPEDCQPQRALSTE